MFDFFIGMMTIIGRGVFYILFGFFLFFFYFNYCFYSLMPNA